MKPKDKLTITEAREIQRNFQLIALAATVVLAVGVVFYHVVEKFRWIDSLYFSVVTLTTVGYGDFTPKTDIGKLFTIFYLLIGIAIIASLLNTLVRSGVARRKIKEHEESNK
jgi:voltage-gated potassium channel